MQETIQLNTLSQLAFPYKALMIFELKRLPCHKIKLLTACDSLILKIISVSFQI